jgi:hypothetical protein
VVHQGCGDTGVLQRLMKLKSQLRIQYSGASRMWRHRCLTAVNEIEVAIKNPYSGASRMWRHRCLTAVNEIEVTIW